MKSVQQRDAVERRVIASLYKHLGPSVGELDELALANFEIDPARYSSRESFLRDYAYVSFLRKWKGIKNERINPEWVAFATWTQSEQLCFKTNVRLEHEASTGSYSVAPSIISDVQRKISRILGPVNMERIAELCRFGTGATFDKKRGTLSAEKTWKPSVTFDAIPVVCQILSGDDYLGSLVGPFRDLTIVETNRMVMVPKTVKTHRPIAAEPTLNGFVQQGIGRYIRRRLFQFGVDLNDQTINQDLAKRAYSEGFSTIDLSSASDTLCINLVKLLLPREWFEILNSVRSPFTTYKGKRFRLSKFSSMGNAYTFELESMIFYALVSCVCVGDVSSVYGDDIVVKHEDYDRVVEILNWAGFNVNATKSYTVGSRFFESCGKHYFDGEEVTPCYQKDVCTRPHDYVRLHNRLVRAGMRLNLRLEFNIAARIVLDECRSIFGKKCPDIGPNVEYDEYFIKEDYAWKTDTVDRVSLISAITRPVVQAFCENERFVIAYYGRKLRSPSFLNVDPKGHVSDTTGSKLLLTRKYHWRSATF